MTSISTARRQSTVRASVVTFELRPCSVHFEGSNAALLVNISRIVSSAAQTSTSQGTSGTTLTVVLQGCSYPMVLVASQMRPRQPHRWRRRRRAAWVRSAAPRPMAPPLHRRPPRPRCHTRATTASPAPWGVAAPAAAAPSMQRFQQVMRFFQLLTSLLCGTDVMMMCRMVQSRLEFKFEPLARLLLPVVYPLNLCKDH